MNDEAQSDEWDEDVVFELRRFALEQALVAHMHRRDAPVDVAEVFKLADRMVNYVLGDLTP